MVKAKRFEQAPADEGKIITAPCVGRPVHDARGEIRGGHARKDNGKCPPSEFNPHRDPDRHRGEQANGGGDRHDREDALRTRHLVVTGLHRQQHTI